MSVRRNGSPQKLILRQVRKIRQKNREKKNKGKRTREREEEILHSYEKIKKSRGKFGVMLIEIAEKRAKIFDWKKLRDFCRI